MSEQRYVNRVDQSQFQKLEGQKLAHPVSEAEYVELPSAEMFVEAVKASLPPKTKDLKWAPVTAINPKDPTKIYEPVGWNLPVVEESDDPQAGQTGPGQDEDPRDNIGNSFEHYEVDPAKVLSVLSLVDEKFKQQVIAAFKHLGLPVNKFFPGS